MQKVKKSLVYCIFFPLWICLGNAIFHNRFNERIVNVIWNNISTCCNFKITFNTEKEVIQNFHCIKYQFQGFPPFHLKSLSCLIILSDKNGLMICQKSLVICNVFFYENYYNLTFDFLTRNTLWIFFYHNHFYLLKIYFWAYFFLLVLWKELSNFHEHVSACKVQDQEFSCIYQEKLKIPLHFFKIVFRKSDSNSSQNT